MVLNNKITGFICDLCNNPSKVLFERLEEKEKYEYIEK